MKSQAPEPQENFFRVLDDAFPRVPSYSSRGAIVSTGGHLLDVLQTLHRPGQCPVIFGPPGIGKTTIAWQAEMIAKGNVEILEASQATKYALPDAPFETFRFSCASASLGGDSRALLEIIARELSEKAANMAPNDPMKPTEREVNVSLGLNPKIDFKSKYARHNADEPTSIERQVIVAAAEITRRSQQPVLIVVDDLDRLDDTASLSGLLRDASDVSDEDLRFVLVGTAMRVNALLQEYADLNKIANPIEISPFPAAVLIEIVQRGLATLATRGFPYSVDTAFVGTFAAVSDGVPASTVWLIREAIRLAERYDCSNVSQVHANAALLNYVRHLRDRA